MKNNFFLLGALCIILLFCASCTAQDTNDAENRLSSKEDFLDSVKSSSESSDTSDKGEQNTMQFETSINTSEIINSLTVPEGRVNGSDSNIKAGDYIDDCFKSLGLIPLDKEGYGWKYNQDINGNREELSNIVGYIKGSDHTKAIVVSAHYDAVAGSLGAVDNASGVAAMIQVAAKLTEYKDGLRPDIVFCAFNSEEENYKGSIAFVKEFKKLYSKSYNINLDCVGVKNGGDYMMGYDEGDVNARLIAAIRKTMDDYSIKYGTYLTKNVRSDHVSFHNADFPAANFTQKNIVSITHSVNDTISQLDTQQIDHLSNAVVHFIISSKDEMY